MQRWQAILVVLVLGLVARPAAGAVGFGGPWLVSLQVGGSEITQCSFDVVQSGGDASFTSSCFLIGSGAGTVDSATGAFLLTVTDPTLCPGSVMTGTVAADGRSFTAHVSCLLELDLVGDRCGNRVVEDGETCDDGGRLDGDCCSATCVADADGTACDDGSSCTTGDVCDGGACRAETLPDGAPCDDGSVCTQDDACVAGFCYGATPVVCDGCNSCDDVAGCVPRRELFCDRGRRGGIRLADDVVDARDRAAAHLGLPRWVTPLAFGDPRRSTSWNVCVFEDFGFGDLLASLSVPAGGTCGGKPCWRPTALGYRYEDATATSDGVRRFGLVAGRRGRIEVRAAGAGMQLGPLPATLPVVVQVKGSDGQCWEADFFDADVNAPTQLRARTLGDVE